MTVSASSAIVQYNCNGSLTEFDFTFGIDETSEITVILTDSSDVETTLTETTHYSVSATNNDFSSGGKITTVSTYASGYKITIMRDVPLSQDSDFTEGQATLYESFEDGLDKLTRIAQDQARMLEYRPYLPYSCDDSIDLELPNPEAGKALGWKSGANGFQNLSLVVSTTEGSFQNVATMSYYSGDFDAAVAAIGSTETTLIVDADSTMSSNVSTVSTLTVIMIKGGSIDMAGYTLTFNGPLIMQGGVFIHDATLTINGPFIAPYENLGFSSSYTLTFGLLAVEKIVPQWWNAKGDGSTDDQAPIAGALAAIKSSGGGWLYLPGPATYLMDTATAWRLCSYCTLEFAPGAKVKLGDGVAPAGGLNIFQNDDVDDGNTNINILNPLIDGNKANNSSGKTNAICFKGVSDFFIFNPIIYNNASVDLSGAGDSIYMVRSANGYHNDYGTILGGRLYGNVRNGLSILDARYVTVIGTMVYDNGQSGIDVEPISVNDRVVGLSLSNIKALNNGLYGVVIYNAGGASVSPVQVPNLYTEGNGRNGLYLSDWDNCNFPAIVNRNNSQSSSGTYSGVYINDSLYAKFNGPTILGTDHKYGIEMAGTSDFLFVNQGELSTYTTGPFSLLGTHNKIRDIYTNESTTIASAATITLPVHGSYFAVTGTVNITSITASWIGRKITLVFQDVLTVTDGSNLSLAGNFATSGDDTLTLISDGTNWRELSRSAN